MKNILSIVCLLISMAVNAQNQTVTLENRNGFPQPDIYYKDADNILSPYAGTYSFTTDEITFRIKLVKATKASFGGYYEDLLIGGYKYTVNGITVANTLNQIEDTSLQYPKRSIYGSIINKNYSRPACSDCVINDKRPTLSISDDNNYATMTLFRTTVNGQAVLKVWIYNNSGGKFVYNQDLEPAPVPIPPTYPIGEFNLIKE